MVKNFQKRGGGKRNRFKKRPRGTGDGKVKEGERGGT